MRPTNGEMMKYQQPGPYQPGYGAPMYPPPPTLPNSGMAIGGMVLGIVSIGIAALGCCIPFIGGGSLLTGVPAVACSWYSLTQINRSMGSLGGKGMAISGIATGAVGCLIGVGMLIFWSWLVTYNPSP
ncbi:MAG: hypothetical protein ACRDUA_05815 [Micromonosporaceae bacterium]